jgi:hypothetical protein
MKKLYILAAFVLLGMSSFAQTLKFKITDAETKTNLNGNPINKGDEFEISVWVNPNGNTTARSLYFDFEYQNTAFQLMSVAHTGTNGNGGALPTGSNISMNHQDYPGYSWLSTQQNSSTDGNVKYNNANYNYTPGGPKSILRIYLNWATTNTNFAEWHLIKLRFKLKTNAPGYSWDPIRLNFVAAFNQNGTAGSTIMEIPETTIIYLDPVATSFINGNIEINNSLQNISPIKVAFIDSALNQGPIFDVTSAGKINIDQSQLKANTIYHVMAMINMDNLNSIYNAAVTVSDYTVAEGEFITQNLDGTFKGENIKTGMGYFVADINRNKTFDGGDVTKLFSQAVSVDELIALPSQYTPGTNGSMSVPTFKADVFNTLTPETWKTALPYVSFKTGEIGTNLPLNLKYALWGDINRSHSSQVIDMQGIIKLNSISGFVNTPTPAQPIDVILKNEVITSNNIEIPITLSTGTTKISALQFEFLYDATKIKFEQLLSSLPNGWVIFGTPVNGKIKFGAIDKELKVSISGNITPFKLKFTSLVPGIDIATQIKVSNIMDAADDKGKQLGINLNTTIIKITGYNKFN